MCNGQVMIAGSGRMNRTDTPPRGSGSVVKVYGRAPQPPIRSVVNHPVSGLMFDSGQTVPSGSVHVAVMLPKSSLHTGCSSDEPGTTIELPTSRGMDTPLAGWW